MHYEKMTVEKFAKNLESGKYQSLTGARRAIGKTSSWKARERDSARVLAEKHFTALEAKGKKTVAKTPPPAKKTAKKVGTKTRPAATSSSKTVGVVSLPPEMRDAPIGPTPFSLTADQIAANPHHAVSIADRTINSVATALATAQALKARNNDIDIKEIEQASGEALRKSVCVLDHTSEAIYSQTIEHRARQLAEQQASAAPVVSNVAPQPEPEPVSRPYATAPLTDQPGEADLLARCHEAAKAATERTTPLVSPVVNPSH